MATTQALFNEYQAAVAALSSITDFYEYEKRFVALHDQLGRTMLQKSLEQREDKGYKKNSNPLWND